MFPGDLKQMHKTNVEAYDSRGRLARIPEASRTGDRNLSHASSTMATELQFDSHSQKVCS